MKVKSIVAASVLVMSAAAGQAQEYVAPDAGFVSSKTRAQVVAELEQAKADTR
ncbi:DUF4148 domain-containing protein [Noviherbaspirillum aridicola]|uniref:DUF4148 domain-containing protein n=1 Tax=Noviherbaspirillum aridicola TaxID=2849687 RepID=UPI001C7E2DFB|nr:DUF4148 domain-containing protein [Noviherbaspirillum aridicola]